MAVIQHSWLLVIFPKYTMQTVMVRRRYK